MGFLSDLNKKYKKARRAADQLAAQSSNNERRQAQAFYFKRDSACEMIRVVGESHYQDGIRSATGRKGNEGLEYHCVAAVVPELDNPKDANAVNVQINGYHVGYLSREDARIYRDKAVEAMRRGSVLAADAMVRAVDPEKAQTPNAGVVLWLPPPQELEFPSN